MYARDFTYKATLRIGKILGMTWDAIDIKRGRLMHRALFSMAMHIIKYRITLYEEEIDFVPINEYNIK